VTENLRHDVTKVHVELQRVQTWLFAVPRLCAMMDANALLGESLRVAQFASGAETFADAAGRLLRTNVPGLRFRISIDILGTTEP
ncbi:MAG: hypothetical protein AB1778_05635, partial [Candidatus Bipolaricaulota bacterium]